MLPIHHEHASESLNWTKFRLAYEGGRNFVNRYLRKYSSKETDAEFADRLAITYSPSHAKAAIMEIKNSIFSRMCDVVRMGGDQTYKEAVAGLAGGVDYAGHNMTSFIGTKVLPEFLTMRKVGIYIDKEVLPEVRTKADEKGTRPYLYIYRAEDILSWSYNKRNQLSSVLLRSYEDVTDDVTGCVINQKESYRLLQLIEGVVLHSEFDSKDGQKNTVALNLTQIPFVIVEMTESLMIDIADYQIALLNLESSDINYLIRSNFPFYTEQYSPLADGNLTRQGNVTVDADGKPVVTVGDGAQQVKVGVSTGRRYPKGMERPGFINPSPEPMNVSMAKQTDMKSAIRQLVQLALSNLAPQRASGESKQFDQQGLEAGLSYIGLELETAENQIATIWAQYQSGTSAVVAYPDEYSMSSTEERLTEAEKLIKTLPQIPSLTYQKLVAKRIAFLILGRSATLEQVALITKEIDAAKIIAVDPKVLLEDLAAGLVAMETASAARGYPDGDVKIAKKEHIERLAAIAIAQTPGGGAGSDAARGVATGPQDDSAKDEKESSQSADNQPAGAGKAVRGEEE